MSASLRRHMKISKVIKTAFKRYFLVGLIVILPIGVTIKFLFFFIDYLDQILEVNNGTFLFFIPEEFHPDFILGFHIPGLGVVFSILIILFVGVFSRNYMGKKLVRWTDQLVGRIPFARVIYNVVKDFLQTYVARDRIQYSRVVLVEFPRKGIYTLGLVTGVATGEVQERTKEKVLNIFVATTPNPTSGFYLMVPEEDVVDLKMTIEDAFKLIMSGGLVSPEKVNGALVEKHTKSK